MDRRTQKLNLFVAFANQLATLSCCKVAKHGCIIIPPDFSGILALGYNGPARGQDNNACTGQDGSMCGCAHAEGNAIAKLNTSTTRGAILICTKSPCWYCSNLIINCGSISEVLYVAPWSLIREVEPLFFRAGVNLTPYNGKAYQ